MDKKLFRSILLLVACTVLLVAVVVKIDLVLDFFGRVLALLSPLFIAIGVAFVLYPLYKWFREVFIRFGVFLKSKKKKKTETTKDQPETKQNDSKVKAAVKKTGYLFSRKEKNKNSHKVASTFSIIITYVLMISFVSAITWLLIPQLIDSITKLIEYLTGYLPKLEELLSKLSSKINIQETVLQSIETVFSTIISGLTAITQNIIPFLLEFTKNIASGVTNVLFGLIMSIYMILDKDRLVRSIANIFKVRMKEKNYVQLSSFVNSAASIFSRFITSRFIDSLIIGILCYICMLIFRFPYPLLISVFVGVTNVIPVIGPFIGAIPSIFIILIINPVQAFWFAVFILILQQIDGNIIGPKVTGDSIGLPVIWTMLAIIVGGGLFGVAGMLVGVPVVATAYNLIVKRTNAKLAVTEDSQLPESDNTEKAKNE